MKNKFYLALVVMAVILVAKYAPPSNFSSPLSFSGSDYPHADVVIGNEKFDALAADTEGRQEDGLSGFKGLEKNEAMLFSYEKPSSLPFWMKDMLFSIDILWLDGDFHIVHFEKSASPDSYPKAFSSEAPAQYVIELYAGTLDRLDIHIGDKVSISLKK